MKNWNTSILRPPLVPTGGGTLRMVAERVRNTGTSSMFPCTSPPPPLTLPLSFTPPPLTPPPGQKERDTAQAKRHAKKSRNRDPDNRARSLLREIGDTYRGPNTYFDTPTNTSFNTPTNNTLLQTSSNNPFNPSFNTSSPPLLVPLSRDRSGGIQRQRTDGQ